MRSVKSDGFDRQAFKTRLGNDPGFSRQVRYTERYNGDYPDMVNDLFQSFYQENPEMLENPDPIFKGFLDSVKDTEGFAKLRTVGCGNANVAYFAAKEFEPAMASVLIDNAEIRNEMKKAQEERNTEKIEQFFKKNSGKIRRKLRAVIDDAAEETEKFDETVSAMGMSRTSNQATGQEMKPEEAMEIANKMKNNKYVREICKLLGRNLRQAKKVAETKTIGREGEEIVGVTHGNELADLLTEEVAAFFIPVMADYQALRLLNEETMVDEKSMKEPRTQDAVIACIDESGSMDGISPEVPGAIVAAKAMLCGLWLIAVEQRRPFFVVRFGGPYDCITVEIIDGKTMMHVMENFLNAGSTDFNRPLQQCVEIIKGFPKAKSADVIFITDGGGYVRPEIIADFKAIKERLQFKMIGLEIALGSEETSQYSALKPLDIFTQVFILRSLDMNSPKFLQALDECFSI